MKELIIITLVAVIGFILIFDESDYKGKQCIESGEGNVSQCRELYGNV